MNNNKLAIDDMAARWGFRVGQEEPVSCTILVSGVDIHNVTVISEALEVAEDVEVDEVTRIGDGQVLIDYTANSDRGIIIIIMESELSASVCSVCNDGFV